MSGIELAKGRTISTRDPELFKQIMLTVSSLPRDLDLEGCMAALESRGVNISYIGTVYRALQILVRSNLLKRGYSAEGKRVVYRLNFQADVCLV